MIRFIIAVTFLVLVLIISYPIFLVEWVIGKINKRAKDYSSLRFAQWAFRVILRISGVKVTVIGKENIPDEAALFVGNHRSFFDILILYVQCEKLSGFIAKDGMNKIPSLRVWMRYLYCLFLDRKDIRQGMKVILQAIEYIKQGISIYVFPEGTRNKGEELNILPFKEGTMKIALKTGCKVVPFAMNNTADIFENHFPKLKKTHVILEYGKPIDVTELDREQQKHLGATCQKLVEEMLKKNAQKI